MDELKPTDAAGTWEPERAIPATRREVQPAPGISQGGSNYFNERNQRGINSCWTSLIVPMTRGKYRSRGQSSMLRT